MAKLKKFLVITLAIIGVLTISFAGVEESENPNKISDYASQKSIPKESKKTATKEAVTQKSETESKAEESQEAPFEAGIVTRVIDGDTIVVLVNGKEEKVRLIGIDTPERGRPYYEEAKRKTGAIALGKKVRLEKDVSDRDRYGRLLRYVFVGNIFLNAELVRQGYAMVYTHPPDVKYSELFLKLQREAREARRGLWGAAATSNSSGGNTSQRKATYYVASRKSEVFHLPACVWAKKIAPYNLIKFNSREEAINSGRRPCKVCNP